MPDPRKRSPWTGLTSRQALEVADTLNRPEYLAMSPADAAWTLHLEYSRRAAAALVGNDLREALDQAELATAAHTIYERSPGRTAPRDVVIEQRPVIPARLAHISAD